MNRRVNGKLKTLIAALTLVTMLSSGVVNASAQASSSRMMELHGSMDSDGRVHQSLLSVKDKNISSYTKIPVTVGGRTASVNGFYSNGIGYIPFRAVSSLISGSSYVYTSSTKTSVMKAQGLEITASDGCYVIYANGRPLFTTSNAVIMSDGRLYIPATTFAKAVGMQLIEGEYSIQIKGNYNPLLTAGRYYREDEVLWLARIIHAESKGEPLIGQIAVGNVVLNRVKSAYYPNTIYGVIFDRKYGVQFSPVLDGSIYNTPGYNAILAAKICLEGYSLADGVFFFLNTRLATSSWIPQTRQYAFTIGNHDFYY